MLKSIERKIENARTLGRSKVSCTGNHTTIPMEFKTYIKPTGFLWNRTPLKAEFNCTECHQKHEVFFTPFTFWNRYNELKVVAIN
jgi:hypothetical protein